jgi:hypothetical protein
MTDFEPPHSLPNSLDSLDHFKKDPDFQAQVQRLHKLTLYSRWVVISLLWLIVAPLSLWGLRNEIPLWLDYFTWTAVRYSLLYNPLSALGLALCVSSTLGTLIWQSRNALLGLPASDLKRLEKQVLKIRTQGKSHPLWRRVCGP